MQHLHPKTCESKDDLISLEFIQQIPKVELHAHINGCIRDNTLLELLETSGASKEELEKLHVQLGDERNLSQCFDLFRRIHQIVTSTEVVERITREAIEDFAADQVPRPDLHPSPLLTVVLVERCGMSSSVLPQRPTTASPWSPTWRRSSRPSGNARSVGNV